MLLIPVKAIGSGIVEDKTSRADQVAHIRIIDSAIIHEALVKSAISGDNVRLVELQNRLDVLTQKIR